MWDSVRGRREASQRDRHRLDRGGDRQLNHALHVIAITRARHDPATQAYLARKEAEGKTKKGVSQAGFDGGLGSRILSLGEETLRRYGTSEEVPAGAA